MDKVKKGLCSGENCNKGRTVLGVSAIGLGLVSRDRMKKVYSLDVYGDTANVWQNRGREGGTLGLLKCPEKSE